MNAIHTESTDLTSLNDLALAPACGRSGQPYFVALDTDSIDGSEILAADGQERAIGLRLAAARRNAQISKAAMSRIIGRRGTQVITDYETGTSKVPLSAVREIAAATNTDVTWLWLGRKPACQADGAVTTLASIADTLERLNTEIDNIESDRDGTFEGGPGAAVLHDWWGLARTVPAMPVATAADVTALARICRATWARTPGDDCELRDELDQKLQQAVLAQASVPNPDAELIGHCTRMIAALRQANEIGNASVLPIDADARVNLQVRVAQNIEPLITALRATTPEGIVALAQATAAMADGLLISNESDELLIMLLRDSLALGTAHAVPVSPDAELLALHDRFIICEGQRHALCRQFAMDDEAYDAAVEPVEAEQAEVLAHARSLTATTLGGHRARARMMVAWDGEMKRLGEPADGYWQHQLAWLLVRDLLGAEHATALDDRNDADGFQAAIEAGRTGIVSFPNPDAELIGHCNKFCELERQFDATDFSALPYTPEAEAAKREQQALTAAGDPILDRMDDLPTHTLEGFRARARAIAAFDKGELERSGDARGMMWMLVRDLIGAATETVPA